MNVETSETKLSNVPARTKNNNSQSENDDFEESREVVADDIDFKHDMMYGFDDNPPWHLSMLFGLQHYMVIVGSEIGLALLLAPLLCIANDDNGNIARANLISSVLFVAGICTLLQTTLGNRLPIVQGSSYAFLPTALAILALPHNQCPGPLPGNFTNSSATFYLNTDDEVVDGEELWHRRIRELCRSANQPTPIPTILI
ncbi:unnamed protein product [Clavelina lepadiformis]|uniref:Uncharacterized protein n=1 Tax=Clavelina lepadiformis TaxID=159417 RepID=A0ABP0G5G0_CLALP